MAKNQGWIARSLWLLAAAAVVANASHGASSTGSTEVVAPAKPRYVCPNDPNGVTFDTPGFCGHDERIKQGSVLRVAVLIFEGVQLIDFTGPMEIFGQAGAKVFTVAPTKSPRTASSGLKVTPDFDFDDAPAADLLLVPGGNGNEIILNPANKAWLMQRAQGSKMVLAVCTGTFLLGYAGLLDGLPATTFAPQIKYLKQEFPRITQAVRNRRFVDTGKIITTAGLSAGLDGALHVVERWYGAFDAQDLARGIEYDWLPDREGGFGELLIHQMPHWPATVPAGSAWERFYEEGDAQTWETRAHVEFESTPDAYLNQIGAAVLKQGWHQTKQVSGSQTFHRSDGGKVLTMAMVLTKDRTSDLFELSTKISRSGE